MRKSIFSRIFIVHAAILVVALAFSEIYITSVVRQGHIKTLAESLLSQAALISENLAFAPGLDGRARDLKELTGARITIIAPDGKVLGDSDALSARMDNHAGRPEIQQAMLYGKGSSIRHSDTIGHDLLYTALRVDGGEALRGFVRLAVPLKEVGEAVRHVRIKIVLFVALVLLATAGASAVQTGRVRRLVREVAAFSRSIAKGGHEKRLMLEGLGEFDDIARNLNAMAAELGAVLEKHQEEKERLNAVLKSIPDALVIADSKGDIVLSSAASRELFGAETLSGRPVSEVVRSPGFFEAMDSARERLAPVEHEVVLELPEEKYFSLRVYPLFYEAEEPPHFVAVFHDITEHRKLDAVRKDFVANVSHELKTPVSAIKGFADTLLDGALDDRENARRFVLIIKSNVERMASLIEDLMIISKIELGVTRVEKAAVDLEEVMGQVAATLRDRAASKGLYLRTDISPGMREVKADRVRLMQILTNLADNAIKFTDRGGVTLGAEEEKDRKMIFVKDTGVGIPARHLSRLGERFYRVDPSRSRELGGTGLGLAILKHLVRAHGWRMKIESTVGRGTAVRIFL